MRKTKIGLFGGTFDPIHWGHLNLAFELMEKRCLDAVWFIPARSNPHKTKLPCASADHRIAMVDLAIQGIPKFVRKDLEMHRPAPSYTVDTLRMLQREAEVASCQFYLLLGEDALSGFMQWHCPEEIVTLAHVLIGSRSGRMPSLWKDYPLTIRTALEQGMTPTRLMDISATDIRSRLSRNLYCGHLLPSSVINYAHTHGIY